MLAKKGARNAGPGKRKPLWTQKLTVAVLLHALALPTLQTLYKNVLLRALNESVKAPVLASAELILAPSR